MCVIITGHQGRQIEPDDKTRESVGLHSWGIFLHHYTDFGRCLPWLSSSLYHLPWLCESKHVELGSCRWGLGPVFCTEQTPGVKWAPEWTPVEWNLLAFNPFIGAFSVNKHVKWKWHVDLEIFEDILWGYWALVAHIGVCELCHHWYRKCLGPLRCQSTFWINALDQTSVQFEYKYKKIYFKKMCLKMSSANCRPFRYEILIYV